MRVIQRVESFQVPFLLLIICFVLCLHFKTFEVACLICASRASIHVLLSELLNIHDSKAQRSDEVNDPTVPIVLDKPL